MSYADRLALFSLKRLELRRINFDLIELLKIMNGWSTPFLKSILSVSNITFTRGHKFKLFVPFIRKNVCKSYFLYRTISIWNALTQSHFTTNIIRCFKNRISCLVLNIFCLDGSKWDCYPLPVFITIFGTEYCFMYQYRNILFNSILFNSILFYYILFYSILFYSILFYSILFYL